MQARLTKDTRGTGRINLPGTSVSEMGAWGGVVVVVVVAVVGGWGLDTIRDCGCLFIVFFAFE